MPSQCSSWTRDASRLSRLKRVNKHHKALQSKSFPLEHNIPPFLHFPFYLSSSLFQTNFLLVTSFHESKKGFVFFHPLTLLGGVPRVLYRLLLRVSFLGVPGVDELGILLLPPVAEAPPTPAAPSSPLPEAPAGDTEGLFSLGVLFFEAVGGRGRQHGRN